MGEMKSQKRRSYVWTELQNRQSVRRHIEDKFN
jgi:hypothetical protein